MLAVNEQSRPPYIQFQERFVEDRKATMETGKYSAKGVDWVIIRQAGSKDTTECEATDWLDRIGKNPGYSKEWVEGFRDGYQRWKKGQEPAALGTHVRHWPQISPAQAEMLVNCGVLTVEDLAVGNEPLLQRIGMGARDLKAKAQAWLDSAQKIGATAEELASLRQLVVQYKEQNDEFRAALLAERARNGTVSASPPAPIPTDTDPFA